MKTGEILKIGIGILLFIVVLYSLATSISITSKEGFLVGTTGIAHTCTPGVTLTPGEKCYDISLKLVYLRTMTDGIPYYARFGFRPVLQTDYDIFKYNRTNYKLNKKMKKNNY